METNFVALTGADTLVVGGFILPDLMDGDVGSLEFTDDLVAVKVGKDGNTAYALNAAGRKAELKLRVVAGGPSDQQFGSWMRNIEMDMPSFELLDGTLQKRLGDGQGNITYLEYALGGGVVKKKPAMTSNVEGNTEQAVSVWEFTFAKAIRKIG